MGSRLLTGAGLALILLGIGATLVYSSPYLLSLRPAVKASPAASCDRPRGYSLLIADDKGFNGSASHGAPETPWPVIQASKGETVNLLLCNLDPVQAHGFAIDHYFDGGVVLKPGDAYIVSFVASAPGFFRIYCNVFCSVHRFMSGRLTVVV